MVWPEVFSWHAVITAKIASVRHCDPKIAQWSAKMILKWTSLFVLV